MGIASRVAPPQGCAKPATTPLKMLGGASAMESVKVLYWCRLGEAKTASHMAALPSSFLNPGTSFAVTRMASASGAQL